MTKMKNTIHANTLEIAKKVLSGKINRDGEMHFYGVEKHPSRDPYKDRYYYCKPLAEKIIVIVQDINRNRISGETWTNSQLERELEKLLG